MFYLINAHATIEHTAADDQKPTAAEISRNRACFEDLAKNGCEDPGENIREFRKCLHDVFPKLTDSCQKLTSDLYGRRK
jgi:hypothetical protein